MLPEVKTLLEIQILDQEVLELQDQVAKYPTIWEEVKQRAAKKKEAYDQAVKNRERHQKDRRRVEQNLRMYSEELRRSQTRHGVVKTAKEYEAINKQIESVKEKISDLETQGMQLIEKDADVEKAVEDTLAEFKKVEDFYKTEKERIRVQFKEKKARIAELEAEKDKIRGKADDRILSTYDRILKRHPGTVIAPVRSGSCSGCHFGLLPNDLVLVHKSEKVVHCPNCGRILSEDEDYVPEEHATVG